MTNTAPERIEALAAAQRAFYATGATRDINFRKMQLRAFRAALQK